MSSVKNVKNRSDALSPSSAMMAGTMKVSADGSMTAGSEELALVNEVRKNAR